MKNSMRFSGTIYLFICFSLFLSGCAVGPDYRKSEIALDPEFGAGIPEDSDLTMNAPLPGDWWALLGDTTLTELIEAAAAANHDIRIAEARLREARAGKVAAGADLQPQIQFGGTAETREQSKNSPTYMGGETRTDLFLAGFDASWEIDIFGGIRRRVEAAEARLAGAQAGRNEVIRLVLAELALNYVELRGLQQRKNVLERNIKVQRGTVDFTQNRLLSGLGTELDVAQARAQLLSTESAMPGLEAAINLRIFAIGTLLGENPASRLKRLQPYQQLPPIPEELFEAIPSEVLLRRPDVQRAERLLAAEVADIGAATADLFPRFTLFGGFGTEADTFDLLFDSDSLTWSLGPSMQLPIFQGNRLRANIEAQNAQADAALATYEQTILRVLREVESALTEHGHERLTVKSLEKAKAASNDSVQLAKILYQEGLSDILTVLNAESLLLQVENDYSLSRTKEWTSLIRLYKALGGGWQNQG